MQVTTKKFSWAADGGTIGRANADSLKCTREPAKNPGYLRYSFEKLRQYASIRY
jgi:hypothetical protein